jgi:hypothetical protein
VVRKDIQIFQGADFELPLALQHTDGTVYDLTHYPTGRGQIRKFHRSTSIIVSFTVTIPTPTYASTDGKLTISLTGVQTAAIPAGELITDVRSKYVYDLELVGDGTVSGKIIRILYGLVFISPDVTR